MISAEHPQIRNFIVLSLLAHLVFAGLLSAVQLSARLPADRPLQVRIVDQPTQARIRPPLDTKALGDLTTRAQRPSEKAGPPRTPNSSGIPHLKSASPPTATAAPSPQAALEPRDLTQSMPSPPVPPGRIGISSPDMAKWTSAENDGTTRPSRLRNLRDQVAMLWKNLDPSKYSYQEADTGEEGDTGSPTAPTISLDSQDSRYASYLLGVKRQIERFWSYPPEARGLSGNLVVTFGITRDGHLIDLQLTQTSGIAPLDNEAIRAIRQATPFTPFPERMRFERLNIRAGFYYYVSRAGFRDR